MNGSLMDVKTAAARLGIHWTTLRDMVAAHQVQCTRIGRLVRFTEEDLDAFVAARKQYPVDHQPALALLASSVRVAGAASPAGAVASAEASARAAGESPRTARRGSRRVA